MAPEDPSDVLPEKCLFLGPSWSCPVPALAEGTEMDQYRKMVQKSPVTDKLMNTELFTFPDGRSDDSQRA